MSSSTVQDRPIDTSTEQHSDDINAEEPPKDGKSNWHFNKLTAMLKLAEGKVSRGVLGFIEKYLKGTRLIFVVGQSGSGKTTLLGEITNQKLKVGNSLKSGTLGHHVLPAIVHGQQYLFVDTAGFGAQDLDNKKVYEDIMGCLCTLNQWVTIVGVMFVHDARQDRLTESEMRTVRWLQAFCGPQFFENITVVQTQWDRITEDDIEQARDNAKELERSAFEDILFPKHVIPGRVYNHGVRTEDGSEWDLLSKKRCPEGRSQMAADFVRDHYERCNGVAKLQVLEELDKGWDLYETEAAKSLFGTTESPLVILRHKAFLVDLDARVMPKVIPQARKVAAEPPEAAPEATTWKWWQIAKQVAWVFAGFQTTGKTKFSEFTETVTADAWERLKSWWSGTAPS